MKIENANPFGTLSAERLAAFERELGGKLPASYRAFLLAYNGGKPIPCHFLISEAEGTDLLDNVYGLHDGPAYARLDAAWEVYKGRIPAALLPIADDPFGNVICLGRFGAYAGKVYFWDHELELDRRSPFGNVTLIANTFTDFLAALRDPEDDL